MKILILLSAVLSLGVQTASALTFPTTLYIAIRTDGQPGTGTQANPFDGSTQTKFDALMSAIPANTTINLAAGTYLSYGVDAFTIKTGWVIKGAGMGLTTLKLAPHATTRAKMRNLEGAGSNITVSNLTCDGNYQGYAWPAHYAIGGLSIGGSNNTADHVETINCYGDAVLGLEQFSILLCGLTPQQGATNLTIENCLTHKYAAGATYTNGPGVATCTNSRILNCTDDGGHHGFGISAASNLTISGCISSAATFTAFYTDTGSISDLTIQNNSLTAAQMPIQFNSAGAAEHIKIVDNKLTSYNNSGSGNCGIGFSGKTGSDFQIIGNTYHYAGAYVSGFILNNGQVFSDLDIEDNSSNANLIGDGGAMGDVMNVATVFTNNKFKLTSNQLAAEESQLSASSLTPMVAASPSQTGTSVTSNQSAATSPTSNSTTSTVTTASKTPATTTPAINKTIATATSASKTSAHGVQAASVSSAQSLLNSLLQKNPAGAAKYAEEMPPGPDRIDALQYVAQAWSAADPAAATAWLASLPDSDDTQAVYNNVAEKWASDGGALVTQGKVDPTPE